MSLIELIVYIALLVTFLLSAVFSAYSMLMSVMHDTDIQDAGMTNSEKASSTVGERRDSGFVAITSALFISTVLLVAAVGFSGNMAWRYDTVLHSEIRTVVRGHAYACLEIAVAKMSADYFYAPQTWNSGGMSSGAGEYVDEFQCSIDSVTVTMGNFRTVVTSATYMGVRGRINATFSMNSNSVQILEKDFTFF